MTFAHLVLSARNSAADSSGVMPMAVKPSAAIFSFISGSAISLMISRLRRAIISFGVPAGTMNANHPSPSISGYPASAIVGTSGSAGDRLGLVTAKPRSLPSFIWGTAGGSDVNAIGVCPPSVEAAAGPALLNGTGTRSRPSGRRKFSPMRCGGVATPGDAKLYLVPPDLISATSSFTLRTGSEGCTESTVAALTATVTGSKSLEGSYGTASYIAGLTTIFGGTTRTV